jgi:cysteinyl-tRNA synthetase
MPLYIYNTLTRKKEEFTPLNPPYVGMYVCGPTVYGHSHLGHARSYQTFDVIFRYLTHKGYKVRYVQNITDVGHLVGDRDAGEDKIQKQAKTEKQEPVEIAYKYEVSYFEDMDRLGILRPSISCRATGHIPEMIDLIEKLTQKGFAYLSGEGNIYFNVRKFEGYGRLTNRTLEEAQEGERIERATDKINVEDFALWKKADPNHLMQWNSPWGKGYPGWHIECSVMSNKYLGDTIDIHGGGIENSFPHHECEIAQSEAATGKQFARFFVHHNMLTVNGTKMGKSLGNFIILKDLFKKFDPMIVKFYILLGHYRSPLDFSDQALNSAKTGYERFRNSIFTLKKHVEKTASEGNASYPDIDKLKDEFYAAMDDDFNTPVAISVIYEILKISNSEISSSGDPARLKHIYDMVNIMTAEILGFNFEESAGHNPIDGKLIELLIDLRNNYRKEKNFEMSDKIRDELKKLGVIIKDGAKDSGYVISG